jgi:hypothetical protein
MARGKVRTKEFLRLTLKRKIGYRDEEDEEEEEDMPDATRMKVDEQTPRDG